MLLVVFAVEVLVMIALPHFVPGSLNETGRAFLDAGLLTLVCAPVIWWLIVRPLRHIAIQEHARSETIVANAGEGIVTISREGIVASANRAASSLFELPPEELVGKEIAAVVPGLRLDEKAFERETKTRGLRSDGTEFPLSITISKFPSEPGVDFIAILRDLTEAQRMQEQTIQAAREREALRAQQMATLAQLATGVAHEIRNPLTSIKMLIQVNRDKFAEKGLPTEDLELVVSEILRMERSVNALLDYGRPEPEDRKVFSLQETINKTLRLIEGRCAESGVELETSIAPEPVQCFGDPAQIQQLLLNLALNSLDAMPDGGTLRIELRRDETDIHLTVSDTGSGIDSQIMEHLFSPFVTTKPHGVGLGLGICRRIAESHRGQLHGRNLPEGGACFELILPADRSLVQSEAG